MLYNVFVWMSDSSCTSIARHILVAFSPSDAPCVLKKTDMVVYKLQAFRQCDVDNSGRIDIKELHIGLLILFDKINNLLPIHYPIPTKSEVQCPFFKGQSIVTARILTCWALALDLLCSRSLSL